jgi:hypothetical protein
MSKSPFISEADRNTLAVASDTSAALLELSRLASDAYGEAKAARYLLQVAANSEKPEDREEAYKACKTTQLAARAAFELTADVDNDAGTLRAMSHNLAYNHDE